MTKGMLFCLIITIFVSAIIIAVAIYQKPEGRYQFHVATTSDLMWILDTRSGTLVDLGRIELTKIEKNGKLVPKKANYEYW